MSVQAASGRGAVHHPGFEVGQGLQGFKLIGRRPRHKSLNGRTDGFIETIEIRFFFGEFHSGQSTQLTEAAHFLCRFDAHGNAGVKREKAQVLVDDFVDHLAGPLRDSLLLCRGHCAFEGGQMRLRAQGV